jgi:hypothetical protein
MSIFELIDVKLIDDPEHFLKDTLLLLSDELTSLEYKCPEKKHILHEALEKIVLKIIEIFAFHRVDKTVFLVIGKLFEKQSYLLYEPSTINGSSMFRSRKKSPFHRTL